MPPPAGSSRFVTSAPGCADRDSLNFEGRDRVQIVGQDGAPTGRPVRGISIVLRPPRLLVPGLLLLLAGCAGSPPASSSGPTAQPTAAGPSASAVTGAPSSAPASAAVVEAELFSAGVLSSDEEEYRISFTPDGATAYFARGAGFFPQSRQATIFESQLVDGEWTEPEPAPFSGQFPDLDPWVAPDGESITFSSIRPTAEGPRGDVELFRVEREGDGWADAVHLSALGSPGDELGPSVSADGTIWFASDRAGGFDLYTATLTAERYGEPEPVPALNTTVWEFNPAIDAEGTTVVFTSIDRPGGSGLGDLFIATNDGGTWSEALPLATNTSADEYHPSRSPDGETLFYVRRAGQGGDFYTVPWADVAPAE
jgi:hypothetical protein